MAADDLRSYWNADDDQFVVPAQNLEKSPRRRHLYPFVNLCDPEDRSGGMCPDCLSAHLSASQR